MPELTAEELGLETELNPGTGTEEQAPAPAPADSGTPKPAEPDDPEFDLGMDAQGKPRKVKASELKQWEESHLNKDKWQASNTQKAQEIAAEKEQLKEMYGVIEHLRANPEKAKRIVAILEEHGQAAEDKIDDIDDVLKTLPADDPYAKTLRALKAQNQHLLKTTQDLQTKIGTFENETKSIKEQEAVKQATSFLTKTLDDISKDLKFDDDDDRADWKRMVITNMVNHPRKYPTEEEFKNVIQAVGKAEFEALTKRNERITARYLKSKGGPAVVPTHPAGAGSKPLSKKPTMDTLQDSIEEALKNEETTNKE